MAGKRFQREHEKGYVVESSKLSFDNKNQYNTGQKTRI